MASMKDKKLANSKELREQASHPTLRQRIDTALIAEIKRRLRATDGRGDVYEQELSDLYCQYGNPQVNAVLEELKKEK